MKSLYESILSSTDAGRESIIQSIETWLEEYGIKLYTINDKLEVNLLGGANLDKKDLKELPSYIQFGVVRGDFFCSYNKLTSLRGFPKEVRGNFFCNWNELTTLKGAPREVRGKFYCIGNNLTTLEGAPEKVGEIFDCSDNNLVSLKGAPKEVGWDFNCMGNKLKSLKGAPRKAGNFKCGHNTTQFTKDDVKKVCKVEDDIYV